MVRPVTERLQALSNGLTCGWPERLKSSSAPSINFACDVDQNLNELIVPGMSPTLAGGLAVQTFCTHDARRVATLKAAGGWYFDVGVIVHAVLGDDHKRFYLVIRPSELDSAAQPETACLFNRGQFSLWRAYSAALTEGSHVVFDPPLSAEGVIGSKYGNTQTTFLLPNGETIGAKITLGFGAYTVDNVIHSATPGRGAEAGAIWLHMSGRKKGSEEVIHTHILISETISGPRAVVKTLNSGQWALHEAYRVTKATFFEPQFPLDGVVGTGRGSSSPLFLLPNGTNVGKVVTIGGSGLPRRQSIFYAAPGEGSESDGIWIGRCGTHALTGVTVRAYNLLSRTKSGAEAILKWCTEGQWSLRQAYAVRTPTYFDPPLSAHDVIQGRYGCTQHSFLLPDLSEIRSSAGLGVGLNTTDHRIFYAAPGEGDEAGGVWVGFCAKNAKKDEVRSYVLISRDLSGKAAITKRLSSGQWSLREAYRQQSAVRFSPPLNVADVVSSSGEVQTSFLLPGGNVIGTSASIGIGDGIEDARLYYTKPDEDAFWLWFYAKHAETGNLVSCRTKVDNVKQGRAAILDGLRLARPIVDVEAEQTTLFDLVV